MSMFRPAFRAARLLSHPVRTSAPVRPMIGRVRFESTKKYPTSPAELAARPTDWPVPPITYEALKPKTESPKPNTYLIDVREVNEVAQGMIPSAVNVPLSVLEQALSLPGDTFRDKFGFQKPQKDQEVTFYCRSGKRSTTASDLAVRAGYTEVYNFKGSWLQWVEEEVKKAQKDSEGTSA